VILVFFTIFASFVMSLVILTEKSKDGTIKTAHRKPNHNTKRNQSRLASSYLKLVVVVTALEMCLSTDAVLRELTTERTEERLKRHQEFIT